MVTVIDECRSMLCTTLQPTVDPAVAEARLIGVLTGEVLTQDEHRVGVERDQPGGRKSHRQRGNSILRREAEQS